MQITGSSSSSPTLAGGGAASPALVYVLVPTTGAFMFVALVAFLVFVSMAKKKRSLYGSYNPQKEEYNAPRLTDYEMKLKLPPEERLI